MYITGLSLLEFEGLTSIPEMGQKVRMKEREDGRLGAELGETQVSKALKD